MPDWTDQSGLYSINYSVNVTEIGKNYPVFVHYGVS